TWRFVRTFDAPVGIRDWAILPGGRLVASANAAASATYSLIFLSPVGQYLGTAPTIAAPAEAGRRIRPARTAGHFWVSVPGHYELELRDSVGKVLSVVTRSVEWFEPFREPLSAGRSAPLAATEDFFEDALGHLWVQTIVPNPEYWRRPPVTTRGGGTYVPYTGP